MVNQETIPRYARPTQTELEDMFREPTPAEVMERCTHQGACIHAIERLMHEIDTSKSWWMERVAAELGCDGCCEWSS